jgi:hypothetical protein
MSDAHAVGGGAGDVMSAVLSILEIFGRDEYTFLGRMGVFDISDWCFGIDQVYGPNGPLDSW